LKALVRRPGPRLAEGLVTHVERAPGDVDRAQAPWQAYVRALEDAGWEAVEVPPADDCADAVFVEDTVVVFGHVAVTRGSWWAWMTTGLLVGVGILAKYTMVLFLPSVGLFLLTTPLLRHHLLRRGFWLMCVVAASCCLPILVWNVQHDWVTVRHLLGLSGLHDPADEGGIHLLGPLKYVGGQFALLLGYWFVAWLLAMIAHRPTVESDPHARYLWWLSAPMFLVFLAFSPKTDGGELNWPVTAYLSGAVLTAAWVADHTYARRPARSFHLPSAPPTMRASKPEPAMTAKRSPLKRPTSGLRRSPCSPIATACSMLFGIPRLVARRLAVPAGTIARRASEPAITSMQR